MSMSKQDALAYVGGGWTMRFVEDNDHACQIAFMRSDECLEMGRAKAGALLESGEDFMQWVENDLLNPYGSKALWACWHEWIDQQTNGGEPASVFETMGMDTPEFPTLKWVQP